MTSIATVVPACKGDSNDDSGDATGDGDGDGDGNFDEEFTPPPAGMRRLMSGQYRDSIEYLLGAGAATASSPPSDKSLYDFDSIGATELAIDLTHVEIYETSAFDAVDAAIANKGTLASHVACVSGTESTCYEEVAREFGRVAWRRPLTDDEAARIVDIAVQARTWGEGDFDVGLKYELVALLTAPAFLYMVEVGTPIAELPGEYALTQLELVTRMSFFLTGHTPTREQLDQAEAGDLGTPEQVETLAREMLEQPGARIALDRFFDELYHLRDLVDLQKDAELYPEWTSSMPLALREETLALIDDIVWTQDTDFRRFFDADYTFVNGELASLYGFPGVTGTDLVRVDHPADSARAGVIGQGAFLSRYAHPADTSPTRRGHFIQVKLRCFPIQPPPPGVNPALPPIDPNNPPTKKEQLQMHMEEESCNGCHGVMDPIGLALENFDTVGKFRTVDPFGKPIDSTTDLEWLGTFSNAAELGGILAADEMVPACMVKNIVRGSIGYPDGLDQYPALLRLEDEFEVSDYNLRELMVQLTLNPVFGTVGEPK